jgi:hypothetical protein
MYGIFGIVGHNTRVPADMPERATRSLAQRGPDDSGTVTLHDAGREGVEIGLGIAGCDSGSVSLRAPILGVDGQARSILEEVRGGLVIEPENSDALVNAVCSLATNPELAREMGRNGRECIVRKFSPKPHRGEIHSGARTHVKTARSAQSLPLRLDRSADQNFGVFGFPIPIYNGN